MNQNVELKELCEWIYLLTRSLADVMRLIFICFRFFHWNINRVMIKGYFFEYRDTYLRLRAHLGSKKIKHKCVLYVLSTS